MEKLIIVGYVKIDYEKKEVSMDIGLVFEYAGVEEVISFCPFCGKEIIWSKERRTFPINKCGICGKTEDETNLRYLCSSTYLPYEYACEECLRKCKVPGF